MIVLSVITWNQSGTFVVLCDWRSCNLGTELTSGTEENQSQQAPFSSWSHGGWPVGVELTRWVAAGGQNTQSPEAWPLQTWLMGLSLSPTSLLVGQAEAEGLWGQIYLPGLSWKAGLKAQVARLLQWCSDACPSWASAGIVLQPRHVMISSLHVHSLASPLLRLHAEDGFICTQA